MIQPNTPPMPTTYRNERDYPFCPGCGHGLILNQLNAALVKLGLDPTRVVIVTDIGCQGLGDQYFATNAFHGLHGRSIAYATGIKLADPDLKVIVMMGDGGTGIGGAHLLNAARRNIGLTVLVFNNFNFGMTGGEHSVTTPPGGVTATTTGRQPGTAAGRLRDGGGERRGLRLARHGLRQRSGGHHRRGGAERVVCPAGYLGAMHGVLRAEQRVLPQIAGGHAHSAGHGGRACCIVRSGRSMRGRCAEPRGRGAEGRRRSHSGRERCRLCSRRRSTMNSGS